MKKLLESEIMRRFLLVFFIGFLFMGVGRIMLDVFREQPFDYRDVLMCVMSFFFIFNYIKKRVDKEIT